MNLLQIRLLALLTSSDEHLWLDKYMHHKVRLVGNEWPFVLCFTQPSYQQS
jgi:hypothetical protein